MLKVLGIIPARYGSSRFPAKVLEKVLEKSVLNMVYDQACKSTLLTDIIIATDHPLVESHAKSFGARVVLTDANHVSGTDRCAEALKACGGPKNYDFVLNIQGDEPLISPLTLDLLLGNLNQNVQISSLMYPLSNTEDILNPNIVKVVCNTKNEALYFSRSPIPFIRETEVDAWAQTHVFYKHLGIYAFQSEILEKIVKLPVAKLENLEKLEQLRWLSYGFTINMLEAKTDSIGIDTPEDLIKLRQFLKAL